MARVVSPASPLRGFAQAIEFGRTAAAYHQLRMEHPEAPARIVLRYVRDDHGRSFAEFRCETERGHAWRYSGTAYGGDDERYGGEGRCYCAHCGADGDA